MARSFRLQEQRSSSAPLVLQAPAGTIQVGVFAKAHGIPTRVVELVHAAQHAEVAAMRYPREPHGWDCLGIVHEARGENRQAADCYRKMRDIMRQRPDDYDQSFER